MKKILFVFSILLIQASNSIAQTSTKDRIRSYEKIHTKESPFDNVNFKNIGPTIMSGRITDVEVNPANTNEMYVAYASGGVWHSINNGQSFEPIFDHEATLTIGDMAMDWKNHTLWVGTGEVNSSRSSYAGTGLYKTTDNGKTWQHIGLEESHHIGKIILDPKNANIAYVAVLGHLYSYNKERGIYKTTDGGNTWAQTLYINDSTGCVDMAQDASNPSILYASSWTRTRSAWNFNGTGAASGIYKSTDAGEHWTLLTTSQSGFPTGHLVGRIGLSISASNPSIIYAVVDNNFHQEKKEDDVAKKITARDIESMDVASFLAIENNDLNEYLKENGYPKKYTAENVKSSIKEHRYTVKDIADWKLADADANLFNTPIKGAELYRSNDGGNTWTKTHDETLEGVFFTYGYYFGTVAVSPTNPDKVLLAGYPIIMSEDGGKTFKQIDGDNAHPDYHRIWLNPSNDKHIIACNDGGLNITFDNGKIWFKANNPAVGQFYAIEVDNAKPYNIYGGLQDNGTWVGPSTHTESTAWHQDGAYAYKAIGGGDGMQVQVDTRDNATIYEGYQFGNYTRVNKNTGDEHDIKPIHDIGQKPYRFNWQTPICLSKHNQDIFYMGSNCFHRSMQQGNNIQTLSQDLTTTNQKGNVPFGTLTTISESPSRFGLLYVGTDDGNIHCSKDAGYSWQKISNQLPPNKWVTRVIASRHNENTVYASLNGYRNDDFNAYLFKSNDNGQHWASISTSLPAEPINVIREDPKDAQILYVGTDNGLYVSFDQGATFTAWQGALPRVAIHDMAIQDRENEIILGTHGRSIYISKLDLVQKYQSVKNENFVLLDIENQAWNKNLGSKWASYAKPVESIIEVSFFTKEKGTYTFTVKNQKKQQLHRKDIEASYGMNTISYDLSVDNDAIRLVKENIEQADDKKYYLPAGKYSVELKHPSGEVKTTSFELTEKKKEN